MAAHRNLTLRHATLEDMPRLMEIARNSFVENNITRAMWPERLEPDRAKRLADEDAWHTAAHTKGIQEDKERLWICVEIEEDGVKEIAGWATWHIIEAVDTRKPEDQGAPGEGPPPMPKSLDTEFLAKMRKMNDEALEKALGKDGAVGMYTFRPIVTDPKHQRKGVGRMIVDWGIARAEAEGKDIFLGSSDEGYSLYQKAGFETVGESVVEGVTQRFMVKRSPRT